MGIKAAIGYRQSVSEELAASFAPGVEATTRLNHKAFDEQFTLDDTTTPPATKVISQKPQLSGGTLVIDLTTATHLGAAVDLTGLRLQDLYFVNSAANAVTIEADASNGYLLFGAAGKVIVPPSGRLHCYSADGTPDVGPTAKRIKLTGTGTDQYELQMVFG